MKRSLVKKVRKFFNEGTPFKLKDVKKQSKELRKLYHKKTPYKISQLKNKSKTVWPSNILFSQLP